MGSAEKGAGGAGNHHSSSWKYWGNGWKDGWVGGMVFPTLLADAGFIGLLFSPFALR